MKSITSKSAIGLAISIFVSCAAAPLAQAEALDAYATIYINDQDTNTSTAWFNYVTPIFNAFNNQYLGGAGQYKNVTGTNAATLGTTGDYEMLLPGYQKREGVYKLTGKDSKGNLQDLVFKNKDEAENFCNELMKTARSVYQAPSDGPIHGMWSPSVTGGPIAVGYWIDYNKGHAPAQKHVFCPNPSGWVPSDEVDDESSKNGILKSELVEGSGLEYHLTCVDPRKKEVIFRPRTVGAGDGPVEWFWEGEREGYSLNTNVTTVFEFNQDIGAKFCDENISGIETSDIKDDKYEVTCVDPKKKTGSFPAKINPNVMAEWQQLLRESYSTYSGNLPLRVLDFYVGTKYCE
jgi:hypothetical protein